MSPPLSRVIVPVCVVSTSGVETAIDGHPPSRPDTLSSGSSRPRTSTLSYLTLELRIATTTKRDLGLEKLSSGREWVR